MTLGSRIASPKRRPDGHRRQQALRQVLRDRARERRAVGVQARALDEHDRVAGAQLVAEDRPPLGAGSSPIAEPASSMSSARDEAGQRRRLAAAPRRLRQLARVMPAPSSDCSAVESACQSERPVAKYALMTNGSAPTLQTSLTIAPTASMPTSAKRSSPDASIQWREMIDFVPSPSTTNARCCPPSSSTNADAPRDASTALPPCGFEQMRRRLRVADRVALGRVEDVVVDAQLAVLAHRASDPTTPDGARRRRGEAVQAKRERPTCAGRGSVRDVVGLLHARGTRLICDGVSPRSHGPPLSGSAVKATRMATKIRNVRNAKNKYEDLTICCLAPLESMRRADASARRAIYRARPRSARSSLARAPPPCYARGAGTSVPALVVARRADRERRSAASRRPRRPLPRRPRAPRDDRRRRARGSCRSRRRRPGS